LGGEPVAFFLVSRGPAEWPPLPFALLLVLPDPFEQIALGLGGVSFALRRSPGPALPGLVLSDSGHECSAS